MTPSKPMGEERARALVDAYCTAMATHNDVEATRLQSKISSLATSVLKDRVTLPGLYAEWTASGSVTFFL